MSNRRTIVSFCFLIFTFCLFSGCMPAPYYHKVEAIPQNAWSYNFKPSFTFDVTDSTSTYQPFFIIRHSQAYPYCNLWVWLTIKMPGDSTGIKQRINIQLAESSGKWKGRGMGEIYEEHVALDLGDSVRIGKPGTYTILLEQNMRINPLPEIMNVGIRVEKAGALRQH